MVIETRALPHRPADKPRARPSHTVTPWVQIAVAAVVIVALTWGIVQIGGQP